MAETKMQLVDWLDDLCVRFIINLPREELESVERICFQVEEAQWFYEDFVRPTDPTLPSMNLKQFCLLIFQHCPLLANFSEDHHLLAFEEFLTYKTRVPVRGAILLNEAMDHVLLVKGWKKGASWSFPRGKINKDERDLDCAIREVYEETGYDIAAAGLLHDESQKDYIEVTMREQNLKLFVFKGIPMDTLFAPRTRKEISKIDWYKLASLPGYYNKKKQHLPEPLSLSKLYMVAPFMGGLKRWIAQHSRAAFMDPGMHPQPPVSDVDETQYHDHNRLQTSPPSQHDAFRNVPQNQTHATSSLSNPPPRQVSDELDPAAKLKALLSIAPSTSTTRLSNPTSQEATLLAMLRRTPAKDTPEQSSSVNDSFALTDALSSQGRKMEPLSSTTNAPPVFNGVQPPQGLSAPRPYERTGDPEFAQPHHPGVPSVPPASQLPAPKLNDHALSLLNAFKGISKPTDVEASPPLAQDPSIGSRKNAWTAFAKQLPEVEANEVGNGTVGESNAVAQPIYKETFRQTTTGDQLGKRKVIAVSQALRGGPVEATKNKEVEQAPAVTPVEPVASGITADAKTAIGTTPSAWGKVPSVQAASLLDMFRAQPKPKPHSGELSVAPSQAQLTPGPVELSAFPSPGQELQRTLSSMAPETPKTERSRRQVEPRATPSAAHPSTSATLSGPVNSPEMGTVRRRAKNKVDHAPKQHDITPITILKRPVSEASKDPEVLVDSHTPTSMKQPEKSPAKPPATFARHVLARPSESKPHSQTKRTHEKQASSLSTPADSKANTPIKPFKILKRPQPSPDIPKNKVPASLPTAAEPPSSTFDRRTSATNDRKQTLLSLFSTTQVSPPAAPANPSLPIAINVSTSDASAPTAPPTDPLHVSIASLPDLRSPPPGLELSRSRINSIASAPRAGSAGAFSTGGGARSQTPMSPQDRGFLMNFLEGVVKSAAR